VTLPLGVLQQPARAEGAVRFEPPLARKREALRHLESGPVLKAILRFRRAFWEKLDSGRYADASFFHAPGEQFPTFWTTLPVRTPLLVAWAGGPNTRRLEGAHADEIVRHALASFSTVFGARMKLDDELESAWVHDWQSDPYARGAYSYVAVGGEKARDELAAPLSGTLFFAGEAADTDGEAGTVAGALQSGERAAREVIASLR
jgi:monoamine oxidase